MTPTQIKVRVAAVLALALAPVVFLAGVGGYHLYDRGWSFVSYWPMTACWLAAYFLGWYWVRRVRRPLPGGSGEPVPNYWTDRDQRAWQVVERVVLDAPAPTNDQMADLTRYAAEAQALALEVARIYKPDARDPFGHLTMPEILACGELVAHDLTRTVNQYVPGSHVLSLTDIRRLRSAVDQATDWYPRLRNVYWLASAVLNPIRTGLQVAMTKGAMGPAQKQFQQNIILWFQAVYLRQLGRYLIELNSGRLKVGAKRYLELLALHQVPTPPTDDLPATDADSPPPPPADAGPDVLPVTIAIVGPVKAGKSSLVNAFLGEQRAATDILPLTAGHVRYSLRRAGMPPCTLIDTMGFGNEGPTADDVAVAVEAARVADLVLVVVPARSAARKPEVEFLERVRAGLLALPDLKMPPVVLAVSHVDLLTPAMEWTPPYDWRDGRRPKEVSIREAVAAAREQFGPEVADVVPICTVPGKEVGVRDDLLAAVVTRLGEARGVGLLRMLHAEAAADQTRRVFRQLVSAGGQAAKVLWQVYRK